MVPACLYTPVIHTDHFSTLMLLFKLFCVVATIHYATGSVLPEETKTHIVEEKKIRLAPPPDGNVFDLSKVSDQKEKMIKQSFNERLEMILMNTRNFLDKSMHHSDLQSLFKYLLESENACNGLNLPLIRQADYVFYPKSKEDVQLYLEGYERVNKSIRLLIAYTPLLFSFLKAEDVKKLELAARATNCFELVEDVLYDFPTASNSKIDIKLMSGFSSDSLELVESFIRFVGLGPVTKLLSEKNLLISNEGSVLYIFSDGGSQANSCEIIFFAEGNSVFAINFTHRVRYFILKKNGIPYSIEDFDRVKLENNINTRKQWEEYIEELGFKLSSFIEETGLPFENLLNFIVSLLPDPSQSIIDFKQKIIESERRAVLMQLENMEDGFKDKLLFITGNKFVDCDVYLGQLWNGYFTSHPNQEIETMKSKFLVEVSQGRKGASSAIKALSLCLLSNGKGLNNELLRCEKYPTLIEALLIGIRGKAIKLDPHVFIAVYEATFGASFDTTKKLSLHFKMPTFEFTQGNAKAILYAIALLNQTEINLDMARKLLRQITPQLYEEMKEITEISFESLRLMQYFNDPVFMRWFFALNFFSYPQVSKELLGILNFEADILSNARRMELFVKELLALPKLYIRSAVLQLFNNIQCTDKSLNEFDAPYLERVEASQDLSMKRASLVSLMKTTCGLERVE